MQKLEAFKVRLWLLVCADCAIAQSTLMIFYKVASTFGTYVRVKLLVIEMKMWLKKMHKSRAPTLLDNNYNKIISKSKMLENFWKKLLKFRTVLGQRTIRQRTYWLQKYLKFNFSNEIRWNYNFGQQTRTSHSQTAHSDTVVMPHNDWLQKY